MNGFETPDYVAAVELLRERWQHDHAANTVLTRIINYVTHRNGVGNISAEILISRFGDMGRSELFQYSRSHCI